jgi:hypothetical protein
MATVSRYWISEKNIEETFDGQKSLRETVKVITSGLMTWQQLKREKFIPAAGQEHDKELGFFCTAVKPKIKQQTVWEIEIDWGIFEIPKRVEDPLDRPAKITMSVSLVEEPADRDYKGNLCCTTAGERLTGIMKQVPLVDYTITKNLKNDPKWLQTHVGAVNDDALYIRGILWKPKTLLVVSVSAGEIVTENDIKYAEYSYKLVGDFRGWTVDVWNRGTLRLEQQEKTQYVIQGRKLVAKKVKVWAQVPIMTGDPKTPVTDPVFLNEFGQEIVDLINPDEKNLVDKEKFIQRKFEIQEPLKFAGTLPGL